MPTAVYALPVGREMARKVSRIAQQTGLSKEEVLSQALALGLLQVTNARGKTTARLTAVNPLPPAKARALYRRPDDDREQIDRLMGAQRIEVAD